METTNLSSPVLASLVSIRFFNGRMLTGEDLTREQRSLYARDARVAAALGAGVVRGLDVVADELNSSGGPVVRVTAGCAIDRRGEFIVLAEDTLVELRLPEPLPTQGRPDWRRCADAASDLPAPAPAADAGLYLLVIRSAPVDSAEMARVLQVDRSNDPCMVNFVQEAAVFRLVRMTDLEAGLVGVPEARLRNVVAHACFGTAAVPPAPSVDAPESARAIEALYTKLAPTMACDLPLAVLRIRHTTGLVWIDQWAARRSITAAPTHVTLERATGPRGFAEAEARLLQFDNQLRALGGAPVASASPRAGSAAETFRWVPPAGELPASWVVDGDAWRHFFGRWMAPPTLTLCDARILPALLVANTAAAAIPVDVADDAVSAPAIDVYCGRSSGEGEPTALVYVQSVDGRVIVDLTGAALTASVSASLKVRLVSADGLRSWDLIRLADATWVSPGASPGDYHVEVVSAWVAASPAAVTLVGGRVQHREIAVTALTGTIEVDAPSTDFVDVYEVMARRDGRALAARREGRRWIVEGAAVGAWNILGRAYGRLTRIVTREANVEVQAGKTVKVVLDFAEEVRQPPRSLTFVYKIGNVSRKIKLSMIETSITESDDGVELEIKPSRYYSYKRVEQEVAKNALAAVQALKKPVIQITRPSPPAPDPALAEKFVRVSEPWGEPMPVIERAVLKNWAVNQDHGKQVLLNPLPEEVRGWLLRWRQWLAYVEPSERVRTRILASTPALKVEAGQTLASLADRRSPSTTAEAWAVFGPTAMPVAVTREASNVPFDYMPPDYEKLLRPLNPFYLDVPFDVIVAYPKDILGIYFPWPVGDPEDFYDEMNKRAEEVKKNLEYLPGMTPAIRDSLGELLDPVALANATPGVLAERLGGQYNPVVHALLIAGARDTVEPAMWSIAESGLADAGRLTAAGYTTLGELANATTERLRASLDIDEGAASRAKEGAMSLLRKNAVDAAAAVVFSRAVVEGRVAESVSEGESAIDLASENPASEELSPGLREAAILASERLSRADLAMTRLLGVSLEANALTRFRIR